MFLLNLNNCRLSDNSSKSLWTVSGPHGPDEYGFIKEPPWKSYVISEDGLHPAHQPPSQQ